MWLREGDKNSRYFHMKASMRRHKNDFCLLQNDIREWVEGNRMEDLVISYFKSIFTAIGYVGQMEFLELVGGKVTDSMNNELYKEYTTAFVFSVIQQIHPTKAPSPNWMPLIFL